MNLDEIRDAIRFVSISADSLADALYETTQRWLSSPAFTREELSIALLERQDELKECAEMETEDGLKACILDITQTIAKELEFPSYADKIGYANKVWTTFIENLEHGWKALKRDLGLVE